MDSLGQGCVEGAYATCFFHVGIQGPRWKKKRQLARNTLFALQTLTRPGRASRQRNTMSALQRSRANTCGERSPRARVSCLYLFLKTKWHRTPDRADETLKCGDCVASVTCNSSVVPRVFLKTVAFFMRVAFFSSIGGCHSMLINVM